jgi:hypothetical protein
MNYLGQFAGNGKSERDAPRRPITTTIRAEHLKANTCTAAGITAKGTTPVLALCRQLLAAGLNPDQAMEVFRGGTLALRIRSIGEAAGLEIRGDGVACRLGTAPPMRSAQENGSSAPEGQTGILGAAE